MQTSNVKAGAQPAEVKIVPINALSYEEFLETQAVLDAPDWHRYDAAALEEIVEQYHAVAVPSLEVQALYHGSTVNAPNTGRTYKNLYEIYRDGITILNFMRVTNSESHPTDKRYLLIYIEEMCKRFNLTTHKCPGFGHDVLYSVNPISYSKFDNSLYVPPTTGYWAIVGRGMARD